MASGESSTRNVGEKSAPSSAAALLDQIARQYRSALNRFFERRTVTLAHDCEDLTQEVFARMARRSAREDIAHVERYLFRIAQSVLIDYHRRGVVRNVANHDCYDENVHAVEDFSVEHVLMVREQVDAVYSCLESLPAAVRTMLVLHRFENMTYSEIATRLGVSVSSVEKYMMRALREIALVYEEAP